MRGSARAALAKGTTPLADAPPATADLAELGRPIPGAEPVAVLTDFCAPAEAALNALTPVEATCGMKNPVGPLIEVSVADSAKT